MLYRYLAPTQRKTRNTDDMFVPVTEEQIVRARRVWHRSRREPL